MDAVALKVKIGLRPNGHADHPDWTRLPLAKAENPESHMIHGWVYDKTSGHREHSIDSPYGMQWGVLLVTPQFAAEAVAEFSETITVMTESELELFWDEKGHAHIPQERIDTTALVGLKAKRDLLVDLSRSLTGIDAEISKAIDPEDPSPGVRKNSMKRWVDTKVILGATIGTLP